MQNDNEHIIPLELISRFLAGDASQQDSEVLNSWISESPENARTFDEYRKVWEKTGILEGKPSFNIELEWEEFRSRIVPLKNDSPLNNFLAGPKFFGSFYRMAAIIVLGLVFGYTIYYLNKQSSTQTFYAETGKERIELPDGTIVILNKDASITYPEKFSSKTRLVTFSGEGFFEVKSDSLQPFIIRSNNLSIRVLGTSFNVKADPDSPEIEVIVKTGKVALYQGSDSKNMRSIVAGEKAVFAKDSKEISISENSNPNFLSWETGNMVFNESSLNEVLEVLSSVYHKKFYVTSQNISKCRLTVSFENEELSTVLKILEATLDIHFTDKGDRIEVSGAGC